MCRKKHSRAYEPAMPGPPPGLGIFSLVSTVCTCWKNALWNTGIALATVSLENCRAGLRALRESVYRWGPSWDEATLRQFPVPCPEASSGQTGSCGEDEVSYSTIVCEGRPGLCSHHRSHIPALLATLSRPVLLWAPCSSSVKWACTLLILFLVWRSIRVNGWVCRTIQDQSTRFSWETWSSRRADGNKANS